MRERQELEDSSVHDENPTSASASPAAGQSWVNKTSSAASGAAKVFREFKWGLLTLFLLMVVVISLVYDGGKKNKNQAQAPEIPPAEAAPSTGPAATPYLVSPTPAAPVPPVSQPPERIVQQWEQTRRGPSNPREARVTAIPNAAPYGGTPALPSGPPVLQPEAAPATQVAVDSSRMTVPGYALPEAAVEPAPATGERKYVVQAGDTLSGIAQKHYPGRMREGVKLLSEANKQLFTDPRRMLVGMNLTVPGLAGVVSAPAQAAPAAAPVSVAPASAAPAADVTLDAQNSSEYVVETGDTLERISRKLFNDGRRWRDLYEWNRDRLSDPGMLRVGQKLRVRGVTETQSSRPAQQTEPAKPKVEKSTVVLRQASEPESSSAATNGIRTPASSSKQENVQSGPVNPGL